MKKTIYVALAVFAFLSFVSCQKENADSDSQKPALRTITAVFENNGTKTTLDTDDITPLWTVNDVIRILDGTSYQDITLSSGMISSSKKSITFTTTLTGTTLYAVYPASATEMTSCSGSITLTIPTVQDGTFGSANICVAKGDEDDMVFSNAAAVIEFNQTLSTDVRSVKMLAENNIAGTLTATFDSSNKINTVELSSVGASKTIKTKPAMTAAAEKYYVAIAPVATGDVSFEYQQPIKVADDARSTKTLAKNMIYEVSMDGKTYELKTGTIGTSPNDHNYVQIGAVKWATRNVGATSDSGTDSYGWYFSWGNTTGYVYDATNKWVQASDGTTQLGTDGCFTSANYSEVSISGNGSTLMADIDADGGNDAARVNWGDTWRMPTSLEYQALNAATYFMWDATDLGFYAFIPQEGDSGKTSGTTHTYVKDDALLFFPFAGQGGAEGIDPSTLSLSAYWTSTINGGDATKACAMNFIDMYIMQPISFESTLSRYYGNSIRPVSD